MKSSAGWKPVRRVFREAPRDPRNELLLEPMQHCAQKIKKCTEQTDTRHRSVGVSLLEVRKTHTHITEHFRLVEKSRIQISTPRLHSKSTSVCPGEARGRALPGL